MLNFHGFAPLRESFSLRYNLNHPHEQLEDQAWLRLNAYRPTSSRRPPAWLIGLAAWFIPGAGHLLLRRWVRAVLMGGAVWICFILGLQMGGHMYDLSTGQGWSTLLQVPPMIGNLGTGALYIVAWLLGVGFTEDPQQAARV